MWVKRFYFIAVADAAPASNVAVDAAVDVAGVNLSLPRFTWLIPGSTCTLLASRHFSFLKVHFALFFQASINDNAVYTVS